MILRASKLLSVAFNSWTCLTRYPTSTINMKVTITLLPFFLGLSLGSEDASHRQTAAPLCFAGATDPKCCSEVLTGILVACSDTTPTPVDRAAFRSTCTGLKKQVKCCQSVVLGVGVRCVDPFAN
ncbi:hypothetical protein QBC38DRAFT_494009 [Podospora fimiseda]|uniref:Hydrophobin n=1 Tax=Podospora fimiseda TaxID=252190 RepID=A0AAN7BCB9_9PEZI|nr:hypothetical protein QBC38DRAFT_494009 [Podospora fimiseda]